MVRTPSAVYRASPNSAGPFDSRNSVPGFADFVVPDYSSPAADLAFVDPGFAAVRLVIVVVVVAAADRLSFDPSCSAIVRHLICQRMELPQNGTLEALMSKEFKPGENTGKGGGIFREVGPRGCCPPRGAR